MQTLLPDIEMEPAFAEKDHALRTKEEDVPMPLSSEKVKEEGNALFKSRVKASDHKK